jgi:hypothetical protein
MFFTRVYNRILRPGLAAALPNLRAKEEAWDIITVGVITIATTTGD